VRLVAPVGEARPETVLVAVVVADVWIDSAKLHPDEDGWVCIDLPARRRGAVATLILDAPGYAWSTLRDVPLDGDEVRYHGDVLLEPGRTISGRVVDDDGDGVSGASVTAISPGAPPGRIGFAYPKPRESRTDDAGAFEIRNAPGGDAVVRVAHPFHVARPLAVPDPAGSVQIRAQRAGHIWGRIGREGGGGARVTLRAEPLDPTWAEPLVDGSDSYGRIRMGPLLPGRYRVMLVMRDKPGEPAGPGQAPRPPEVVPDVEMGIVTVQAGKHAQVEWTVP